MTKPYHLTPEQALEILKPLGFIPDPIKGAVFIPSNSRGSLDIEVLQSAINAALDRVLGEPVAYRWYESKWSEYRYTLKPNKHRTCTPLYAPKGLT